MEDDHSGGNDDESAVRPPVGNGEQILKVLEDIRRLLVR